MKKSILKKTFAAFATTALATSAIASAMSVSAAGEPKLSLLADGEAIHYAEPGDVVEVTYNVEGVRADWCSSGVHFSYDNRLSLEFDEFGDIAYTAGPAGSKLAFAFEHMSQSAYPDQIPDGANSIFVATSAKADLGLEGVICSFNFTVPTDAKPGNAGLCFC